uniref:Uncharacterized protein n=1 Tax=Schizaphis graminum TaxID=13262 RepID=A0A2S2NG91_SCHGA
MLPCVKQLLIIFVFISIIDGKNENNNSNKNGICQTLAEYYTQKMFEKSVTNEFFDSEGKDAKARIFVKNKKTKRKKKSKPRRTETCFDSMDYNQFNTFYIAKKKEVTNLKCDLIQPKLPFVPPNKKCKSIGDYYIQFGVKVFYNFFKYLLGIKKKKDRDMVSKLLLSGLKKLVDKYDKMKDVEKKKSTTSGMILVINGYYKKKCNQIMSHYNAFYTFYMKKYTKEKREKGHVDTADCDYFIRIPRD